MDIKQKLGRRIKELRLQRNISQEYMAEKLDVNPSHYSRIETGYSYPRAENLDKICEILNVLPKDLFDFEHHKDIKQIQTELHNIIDNDEELTSQIYKFVKIFNG
ncbi:helix-turn-helix transcriptional regulator [bacterium]|nr:helix-turn-helix transcriptional regulator [bacterium]